jgi:hypothetical protein
MAAIYRCVFKKDENKTNEVSNYIGNKSATSHCTKQISELLRNEKTKCILIQCINS